MQLLIFMLPHQQIRAVNSDSLNIIPLSKHIVKRFFQTFWIFFDFFYFFSFCIFLFFFMKKRQISFSILPARAPVYIIYMSRANQTATAFAIKKTRKSYPRVLDFSSFNFLSATAARFTVSAALLTLRSRGGIHRTCVIAFRFPFTIGTNHLIGIHPYQLFKTFSAILAFVL